MTIKPTFGRHETFSFRYGWLKKGIDAVLENPAIFSQNEALVELGVGKNMVRSIRHWCLATNLINEGQTKRKMEPTTFGKRLLSHDGWDPYLEDIGSYWLIHWELATNSYRAYLWQLLFAYYHDTEFTKEQFTRYCAHQLHSADIKTTDKMIAREADCCLKTYAVPRPTHKNIVNEDSLECPLVELELLQFNDDDKLYSFNIGPKPTLPAHIFGYALYQFLHPLLATRRTFAVDDCLYQPGSPGQLFKLDENSLVIYLEELENLTNGQLRLQESIGMRQLYLDEDLSSLADYELLERYYA